jgi:C4-dicarboxylate-binding protein DctP
MKRIALWAKVCIAVVTIASLFICGHTEAAQTKPIECALANDMPPSQPLCKMADKFGQLVDKRSGGRIKFTQHTGGSLMNRDEWIEALATDTAKGFGFHVTPFFSRFNKGFLLPELPYAVTSIEEWERFSASKIGKDLMKSLEASNLLGIQYITVDRGAIYSKKPLRTPADYQGIKIRVSSSPTEEAMWKQMGASPVRIPMSEVYTAAQTGLCNAVASGVHDWASMTDVLPYAQSRPRVWTGWLLVANKAWLDKVPDDLRKMMLDTWQEVATETQNNAVRESEEDINNGKKAGGTWVELTPQELAKFKEVGMKSWSQFEGDIGKGLVDKLRKEGW